MTKEELLQEIYQAIGSEFFTDSAVLDKRCLELIQKFKGDAIAEHEQKQWKPYPENKPEKNSRYIIETTGSYVIKIDKWIGYRWEKNYRNVIAFRELPEAYQEGGAE